MAIQTPSTFDRCAVPAIISTAPCFVIKNLYHTWALLCPGEQLPKFVEPLKLITAYAGFGASIHRAAQENQRTTMIARGVLSALSLSFCLDRSSRLRSLPGACLWAALEIAHPFWYWDLGVGVNTLYSRVSMLVPSILFLNTRTNTSPLLFCLALGAIPYAMFRWDKSAQVDRTVSLCIFLANAYLIYRRREHHPLLTLSRIVTALVGFEHLLKVCRHPPQK